MTTAEVDKAVGSPFDIIREALRSADRRMRRLVWIVTGFCLVMSVALGIVLVMFFAVRGDLSAERAARKTARTISANQSAALKSQARALAGIEDVSSAFAVLADSSSTPAEREAAVARLRKFAKRLERENVNPAHPAEPDGTRPSGNAAGRSPPAGGQDGNGRTTTTQDRSATSSTSSTSTTLIPDLPIPLPPPDLCVISFLPGCMAAAAA